MSSEDKRCRIMPQAFSEFAAVLSQEELCRKYNASTRVIQRWRKELGLTEEVLRNQSLSKDIEASCRFQVGIICTDKSSCSRCGWNPDEHQRIITIYDSGGMAAVREYILKREMENGHEDNN